MTHKDIYTKFMIEYDKANVTSSYPSLTEYEVATILDKAYNALIALKITGNNFRRVGFEGDLKASEDLRPLIVKSTENSIELPIEDFPSNRIFINIPNDSLYILQVMLPYSEEEVDEKWKKNINPIDGESNRMYSAKHVSHQMAEKFFASAYNIPWIKEPVYYLEDEKIYVIYDPINRPDLTTATVVYLKQPNKFVKDLSKYTEESTYFDGEGGEEEFECNSTVAEELISLAIAFALENVESLRLNSKLNMRGLEA